MRAKNWDAAARLFTQIERYLVQIGDATLKLHRGELKPSKETSPEAAVKKLREKLAKQRVELGNVRSAPISKAEAVAIMKAQVSNWQRVEGRA